MQGVGFHFASFPTALATESLRMALRNSTPDTFTLVGDHESRVTQLLELARQQARFAKALAAPRTREALTALDYILEDQVAALADATDDDKADAAAWAA